MSILQEYEQIRRRLGEPRFRRIELFLADNPELYLSDVYYKESVFKQFEKEEPRYKVLDEEKRIAEIITINKSHGFNAASKELEAREAREVTDKDISINKAFRGYTREELREAVEFIAYRSAAKGETMGLMEISETMRKELGEQRFQRIERFLEEYPQYLVSDVYYYPALFEIFEKEEGKYLSDDRSKRIEEIIKASAGYPFNAAYDELKARRKYFGHEYSVNETFRGYTSSELKEAVDLMESRSAAKEEGSMNPLEKERFSGYSSRSPLDQHKEEAQKNLYKEMIVIREWRPFLGGREIYYDGRVVELEAIPETIDWKKIPLPDLPEKPGDVRDLDITVGYFHATDDVNKTEPLAKFQVWDKTLLTEAVKEKLNRLGDLLYMQNPNGEVVWPIEALNTFNEKELKICKKILFPETQPQQAEIKGGKGR